MSESANERITKTTAGRTESRIAFCVLLLLILLVGCDARSEAEASIALAGWLDAHLLPSDRIAVAEPVARMMGGRDMVRLPEDADAAALLDVLQVECPDVVIAWRGIAWDGVRAQPWFLDRYRLLATWQAPDAASGPLSVWEYYPSPFVGGTLRMVGQIPDAPAFPLRAVRVDHTRLTPGEPLYVSLLWTGDLLVAADVHRLVLTLVDSDGSTVLAQFEEVLVGGLPAELIREGDDVVSRYRLAVPGDLPAGNFALALSLFRSSGESIGGEKVPLITLSRPAEVTQTRPVPDFEGVWHLGDAVSLVGYDTPERLSPEKPLRVAFYWYAREAVLVDSKVFVHLMDVDGALVAQSDGKPVWWTYPTMQWEPGQYIRDEHILELDETLARGNYTLMVGMYAAETGVRLAVTDAQSQTLPENAIPLHVVKVR